MSKTNSPFIVWTLLALQAGSLTSVSFASDTADKDKDVEQTKHIHFPFVHIDVTKHKDGTKDVDVKAPFTKVHNPAGPNNADVKAPFTRVNRTNSSADNSQKAAPPATKNTGNTNQQ